MTDTVPKAWINEDNFLFVIADDTDAVLLERANKELDIWDYPFVLGVDLEGPRTTLWVDPEHVDEESWPYEAVSYVPVGGWVGIYRIDLEEVGL